MDKQSQPFSFDAIKRSAENLGILAKKTVEKAVPYLDPTNPFYDTIPVLREVRMLSNDLLPYDPAADPAIPFKERIPMYLQKYGENFMGSHGGLGKPSVSGKINKASQNQAKGFLPNHVLKDVLRMSDDLNKKGNLSIDDTGLALQYGKQYLGIPEKQFSKQFARMDVKNLLDELMVGMDADQKAAYVDIPNRTKQSNVVNAGLSDTVKYKTAYEPEKYIKMAKESGQSFEDLLNDSPAMLKGRTGFDAVPQTVKVYRGTSKTGRGINAGDWVTTDKAYAQKYGGVIEEIEVPAKDLKYMRGSATGNAIGEFPEFIYTGKGRVAQESIGDSILKVLNKK